MGKKATSDRVGLLKFSFVGFLCSRLRYMDFPFSHLLFFFFFLFSSFVNLLPYVAL